MERLALSMVNYQIISQNCEPYRQNLSTRLYKLLKLLRLRNVLKSKSSFMHLNQKLSLTFGYLQGFSGCFQDIVPVKRWHLLVFLCEITYTALRIISDVCWRIFSNLLNCSNMFFVFVSRTPNIVSQPRHRKIVHNYTFHLLLLKIEDASSANI